MFAILAERELGPHLYGIFPEGRLEEYLPVSLGFTQTTKIFGYSEYIQLFHTSWLKLTI